MARHKKTLICTLLLVVLLLSVALPAAAASVKTVMYLPFVDGHRPQQSPAPAIITHCSLETILFIRMQVVLTI